MLSPEIGLEEGLELCTPVGSISGLRLSRFEDLSGLGLMVSQSLSSFPQLNLSVLTPRSTGAFRSAMTADSSTPDLVRVTKFPEDLLVQMKGIPFFSLTVALASSKICSA